MKTLNVAVVGSGPAGLYTAEALIKQGAALDPPQAVRVVDLDRFVLDAEAVAVIGVGNVAVDVARILIRDPDELRDTDVSQPVLGALIASKVREVHVIGRRGPAQAKFTTKELRELGELAGVDVVVGEGEADLDAFDASGGGARPAAGGRPVRNQYAGNSHRGGRGPARGGRPPHRPFLL